ncbi:MAG: polar amino acid transport system substrate-binding protein [bacterium]|jgi:polar amino acid transport system substrate-binding protein
MGVHVDIVKKALKSIGHQAVFTASSWKRCLKLTQQGKFDGIVSASYKAKRAKFFHYPKDAAKAKKSRWRIMQVEYAVVSLKRNKFVYKGTPKTLPQPVRAPKGYSVVDDLRKQGIRVETAKGNINNIKKLLRDKKGVIIMSPLVAQMFNKKGKFRGKLKIHKKRYTSKSYHFVISKKSKKITSSERIKVWNQVAKIRNNKNYMLSLNKKY